MSADRPRPWIPRLRFLRPLFRALVDEKTYDLKENPTLWVGLLLALPIPLLTFTAGAPTWLKLLSLPAPFFWAVILGAAGRVGLRAQQERDRLASEVAHAEERARHAQTNLGLEQVRRRALEEEQREVVSELKLAQAVQATLLPEAIQRPDVEVVARNVPTRFIGGDYVHTMVLGDRWLYLVLFDVAGHGISAALVVARLHGMVRRLTLTGRSPVVVLENLNAAARQLFEHTYFFMTAVVMQLDLATGALDFATAGHPAQVLLRADGTLELLRTRNRLLGMDDDVFDADRPSDTRQMAPGDTIVLFTDGLFELVSQSQGRVLGESGLHGRIRELGPLPPQLLIGEVLQDLADYQGRPEFDDDVTLVAARYLGPPAPATGSPPRS